MFEEANNRDIHSLSLKVEDMKKLAGDIESAIKDDAVELDSMGSALDAVGGVMRGTLSNLNKMISQGGSKHMVYLVLFVVVLFLVLYKLMVY